MGLYRVNRLIEFRLTLHRRVPYMLEKYNSKGFVTVLHFFLKNGAEGIMQRDSLEPVKLFYLRKWTIPYIAFTGQ